MKKLSKYFEFSGTIGGLTYLLRILLTTCLISIGGILFEEPIRGGNIPLTLLSFILLLPLVWVLLSTKYKMVNAFDREMVNIYTIGIITTYVVSNLTSDRLVSIMLTMFLFGIDLTMILKDSNIKNHKG